MRKRSVSSAYVLDSSALLAVFFQEPGAEHVRAVPPAHISAVNWTEVVTKLVDRGVPVAEIPSRLAELEIDIVDFDHAQATLAGLMRAATRAAGLSLGDRACLALASTLGATAVTADRGWAAVDVGVPIKMFR